MAWQWIHKQPLSESAVSHLPSTNVHLQAWEVKASMKVWILVYIPSKYENLFILVQQFICIDANVNMCMHFASKIITFVPQVWKKHFCHLWCLIYSSDSYHIKEFLWKFFILWQIAYFIWKKSFSYLYIHKHWKSLYIHVWMQPANLFWQTHISYGHI